MKSLQRMGQTPSRNRPSYSSISDGNKEKTGRHRPKHHHATTANPSQPRPIQSQPERTTKVVPVRSTRNSSSPYLELQSERTTEVVPARFELEASEPVHPTLCEGIIPFVMSFSRSSLPPPSFSFKEEIPIPTTIVEKVPDGESPVYGDTGIESFHEDEQACQAYAEPDEMDSEAPSPPPLPPRPTPSEPPSSASSTTLYSSSCTCSMTTSPTSSFSSSSAPPSHKELILRTREHGIGFLCFNWDYSSSTKRTAQGILNARRTSADSMNGKETMTYQ